MFDPRAAEHDFHYLVIAILLIALPITGYFCWVHAFPGIKYKLLKEFGTSIESTVIEIRTGSKISVGEILHSTYGGINRSEYVFEMKISDEQTVRPSIFLEDEALQDKITKKWHREFIYKKNQIVEILYFEPWPKVMSPQKLLQKLAFDWSFFSKSFLVSIVLAVLLILRIRALIVFRKASNYY